MSLEDKIAEKLSNNYCFVKQVLRNKKMTILSFFSLGFSDIFTTFGDVRKILFITMRYSEVFLLEFSLKGELLNEKK
ncbi:MAG: hypothetical protein LBV19_00190 [Streptococcaceae bacterium]|jgi:hypothetical protein|nr:hypothetical protein [Streptococcaceae bacterium]